MYSLGLQMRQAKWALCDACFNLGLASRVTESLR